MASTSERLRQIISIKNIKQAELTEKTGISKGALSSYISGRYVPKQDNIYKLAKVLDVNPAWLMGLDVPMEYCQPAADVDSVAPVQLRPDEGKLLKYYNRLNDFGQSKAMDYLSDLADNIKYLKGEGISEELSDVG